MVGSDLPVLCPNFPEVTKTDVLIMKDYGDKCHPGRLKYISDLKPKLYGAPEYHGKRFSPSIILKD